MNKVPNPVILCVLSLLMLFAVLCFGASSSEFIYVDF